MSLSQWAVRKITGLAKTTPVHSTDPQVHRAEVPQGLKPAPPSAEMLKLATLETRVIGGRNVQIFRARANRSNTQLLYWHGGGYVLPLIAAHWKIIEALSKRTGADIWVPDYPLAFEYTVDDTLVFMDELDAVVAQAATGARYVVAGDSAGGGLGVVHALRARDAQRRSPDHVLLFSPWVDVRMHDPISRELESADSMLAVDQLIAAGKYWAGQRSTSDPMVSPVEAQLPGLPPMSVFQGDKDLLLPDVLRFVGRSRDAGNDVELTLNPGGFHVYVGATFTPEAKKAFDDCAKVING